MGKKGKQIRISLREVGFNFEDIIGQDAIVINEKGGREKWTEAKKDARIVLVINGIGYVFVKRM